MAWLARSMLAAAALGVGGVWVSDHPHGGLHQRGSEPSPGAMAAPIHFGREIRPILSDRCFQCHGPDRAKRQAGLRLDDASSATALRDGRPLKAIEPGDLARSALWERVTTADSDRSMPPHDSGKPALTDKERALIARWIEQGAQYEPHWSFTVPIRPPVPANERDGWSITPIDRFIHERWSREGIAPGPDASKDTLVRRVFLDLTGLPPTEREVQAFVDDPSADAYERLVDRLLTQEPYITRYAERMAVPWLDLSRYADTCGVHMDAGRQIWPWRDWVLRAYRSNMPFDQFTIDQLAGDQYPGATQEQLIASGFNRNHVTTDEGGAIPEEYLVEYWADRTNTVGSVFFGLTLGCARCHDHKFDPVTAEDYYSLLAYFNSIDEPGLYSQQPDPNRALEPALTLLDPTIQDTVAALEAQRAEAVAARDADSDTDRAALDAFVSSWRSAERIEWTRPVVERAVSSGGATLSVQPDGSVLGSGTNPDQDDHTLSLRFAQTGVRLIAIEALPDESFGGKVGRAANGNAILSGISAEAVSVESPEHTQPLRFVWAWASHEQPNGDFRAVNALAPNDGRQWALEGHQHGQGRVAYFLTDAPTGFESGTELRLSLAFHSPYAQHTIGRVRVSVASASDTTLAQLPIASSAWYLSDVFGVGELKQAQAEHGPERADRFDRQARAGGGGWRYAPGVEDGAVASLAQGVGAEYLARQYFAPTARSLDLSIGSDDQIKMWLNGALVHANEVSRAAAPDQDKVTLSLPAGESLLVCKVVNTGGIGGFYERPIPQDTVLPSSHLPLFMPAVDAHGDAVQAARVAWRRLHSPAYRAADERVLALDGQIQHANASAPKTMVMRESSMPRETFVLSRGQYSAPDPARKVTRGVPKALGAVPESFPSNRLGLAQWLVSELNPLTARVTVNRAWEMMFGRGLVRTSEDFGVQGEAPTHPELLDWLAVEFRDNGWNIRELVRSIVTSRVYRMSSRVRPDVAAVDADNRLLSWYPRQRLGAEQIRDQALYIGGLLVEQLGGRSVKPYQPEGLWQEVSMLNSNTRAYDEGVGDDLWRRSMYTYWKRAVPPPSLLTFDAPTREFCTTRRLTTNTPLQALVLWNDPQFVEAARAAAARVLDAEADDRERMRLLFVRTTSHEPAPDLVTRLLEDVDFYRVRFAGAPVDAEKLVTVGSSRSGRARDSAELAAWSMVASAIMSSDATIVKD